MIYNANGIVIKKKFFSLFGTPIAVKLWEYFFHPHNNHGTPKILIFGESMEKAIDFCFRTEGAAESVAPTQIAIALPLLRLAQSDATALPKAFCPTSSRVSRDFIGTSSGVYQAFCISPHQQAKAAFFDFIERNSFEILKNT